MRYFNLQDQFVIDPKDGRGRRLTRKVLKDDAVPTIFSPATYSPRPTRKAPRKRSPSTASTEEITKLPKASKDPKQDHTYSTKKARPTGDDEVPVGAEQQPSTSSPSNFPTLDSLRSEQLLEELKMENELLKQENRSQAERIKVLEDTVDKYRTHYFKDQQEVIEGVVKKVAKYSDETLTRAIVMRHLCGTTGYQYLRNDLKMPLPDISTINNHLKDVNIRPGVSEDCLKLLQLKAKKMSPSNREAILVVDEMSIQPRYEFDSTNKCLSGTITLPSEDKDIPQGGKFFRILDIHFFCLSFFFEKIRRKVY